MYQHYLHRTAQILRRHDRRSAARDLALGLILAAVTLGGLHLQHARPAPIAGVPAAEQAVPAPTPPAPPAKAPSIVLHPVLDMPCPAAPRPSKENQTTRG
jgi:hypothetical protein